MNESDDFEKMLARQLRGASPYIPDDGFTDSVTAGLLVSKPRRFKSPFLVLYALIAVVACVLIAQMPMLDIAHNVMAWVYQVDVASLVTGAVLYATALCVGAVLWAAKMLDII